jgi:cobalt-zinc-cadmium resistance protein CzcA
VRRKFGFLAPVVFIGLNTALCQAQARLSEEEAVTIALQSRASLRAESERVSAAEGLRKQARLRPNPEFQFQNENLRTRGPVKVDREDGQRRIVVMSNVRSRDLGSFVNEVRSKIDRDVKIPTGYFIEYGGQFENQQRATRRLMVIVPVAVAVIFVLLYLTFASAKLAFLVVGNIPFALVGGIAALWIRGMNLNLSASVGFIALFGVAMLNGVVLVSSINQMRASSADIREAVLNGAQRRLRPVLMTAFVASFGFLPMALSTSTGAEVQRPLASVVIGGLFSSTILTLFLLPVLYGWIYQRERKPERTSPELVS